MISRSDMRQLATAAKQGWDVPDDRKRKAVADLREVLDSADAPPYMVETALAVMNTLEEHGWAADVKNAEGLLQ